MPELPEIEVIRLGLSSKIIGLKITKVQINSPKSFIGNPNLMEGQKVIGVWRRAKILGVDLIGELTLLFHLKMSGQLVWKRESLPACLSADTAGKAGGKGKGESFIGGHPTPDMVGNMPNKHTRVIFTFSDGSYLYFNDQRKFGWVKIVNRKSLIVNRLLEELGPEPLEKDFTWEILKSNLLNHKSQSVKVAIMDQTVVSGVGNIYASEACFLARIDPSTKISLLTDLQFKAIYGGIVKALMEGIKHGGSSRAHFVDADGNKGYFLDYAYVYGKNKHKCKKCGTEIKKVQLGGRGTYFCPNCQK